MRLSATLLAAALLVPLGCRRAELHPPSAAGDLLARPPELVLDQPGSLEAREGDPWGRLGRFGWDESSESAGVLGPRFAWSRRPVARLDLPAGRARDRELRLTLWGAEAGVPRSVRVLLNGVELGARALPDERADWTVAAPAAAWRRGTNALELVVDELRTLADGRRVGLALSRVDYGEQRTVDRDARTRELVLRPDTEVRWRIEEVAPMRLRLAARASAAGALGVVFHRVDPATGELREEASTLELDLEAGPVERALPVPAARGGVLELRVAWSGAPSSELAFDALELVETERVERTSIVLVSIDTLSAERLSAYGHGRATAPNLERLAREGVLFESCIANAPWTLPSYLSLVSGLYPYSHRLYPGTADGTQPALWERWYLSANRWTLAELLSAAGWETAGFVDHLWLDERFGFPQGFRVFDSSAGAIHKSDMDGGIAHVLSRARDWLGARPTELPFFLFLHAFDAHGPYTPTSPFRGRFEGDALWDPERTAPAGGVVNTYGIVQSYVARGEVPDGPLPARMATAPLAAAYDEGVATVDAALGELLALLEERDLLERVVLIVTADHGETMDESDYLFGHGVLDQNVIRVPLLVRLPASLAGAGRGLRVTQTVQLVDLYPTLMELAGLAPRAYLHGRSLVPLLRRDELPPAPAFVEGGHVRQAALVDGAWKLVEEHPGEESAESTLLTHPRAPGWLAAEVPALAEHGLTEALWEKLRARPDFRELCGRLRREMRGPYRSLYDLARDPAAHTDVAAAAPDRLASLLAKLRAEEARRERARANARPPDAPVELSADELERLRSLGYAGDD